MVKLDTGGRLGWAGLIVAFFAIAAFYIWPDKKSIGWGSLVVAVFLLLLWLAIEFRQCRGSSSTTNVPKNKIEVVSLVRSVLVPGQPLAAKYEIHNVAGEIIRIRNIGFAQTRLLPRNLAEESENEEAVWSEVSQNLQTMGRNAEIPTFGSGMYNQIIESNPLRGDEYNSVHAGTHVVYFAAIVQDQDTKNNLIELCFFTGRENIIHLCSQHNKP